MQLRELGVQFELARRAARASASQPLKYGVLRSRAFLLRRGSGEAVVLRLRGHSGGLPFLTGFYSISLSILFNLYDNNFMRGLVL